MTGPTVRRALITGGLGTLGRAFAQALRDSGTGVTLLDRPGQTAPEGFGWIGTDLAQPRAAAEAVSAVIARDGAFDILINNAAVIENRPFEEFTPEDCDDQLRVNASAAFALARACAPGMKARGWGRILNLTSVTLSGEWTGYAPYTASKGALLGLTKALARELGPFGITVNAIAPGAVRSKAEDRVFADRLQAYQSWVLDRQCLKSRIQPQDVADLALFLASDRARMITGQNMAVDGGW